MISTLLASVLLASSTSQVSPTVGVSRDAVELAFNDASQFLNPSNLRYIWISGKLSKDLLDDAKAITFILNLISRSQNRFRPVVLVSDKVIILRVDMSLLVKEEGKELFELMDVWEEFRFVPKFSGFVTKGSLEIAKIKLDTVSRKVISHPSGFRRVVVEESANAALNRDGVLRFVPSHVGPKWGQLANLLQTEAPIVDHLYFNYRSAHSVQGKALYKTVYSGLYPKLADTPTSKDQKKQTDLDVLLESLGVGGRGKTAKQIFEKLPSDQRAAIFRSDVTSRLRRIEWFPTLAGRGTPAFFRLTSDFSKDSIDVDQSPIANLLEGLKPDAHEAIWQKSNGLPGFALYDAKFKLQDSVPDVIAKDHTARTPHLGILEPPIGCLRCHAKADGWQFFTNDVKNLVDSGKIDIFGDISTKDQRDANKRILGLYMGSVDRIARDGRNDYVVAIFDIVGFWPGQPQTELAKVIASRVDGFVKNYWEDSVGAKEFLLEMGFEVDEKEAPDFLSKKILGLGEVPVIIDPRIAALVADLRINRFESDFLYSSVMR